MCSDKKLVPERFKLREVHDCVMCGKSFKSKGELAEHQYYNCTGGW